MGKPFQEYRLPLSQLTLKHSSLPSLARKQSNLERIWSGPAIPRGTIHRTASNARGQFTGHRLGRDRTGGDRQSQQQDGAEDERAARDAVDADLLTQQERREDQSDDWLKRSEDRRD